MKENKNTYKVVCIQLCNKLIAELKDNEDEAQTFFGGELHKTYTEVTDSVREKVKAIKNRIKNL